MAGLRTGFSDARLSQALADLLPYQREALNRSASSHLFVCEKSRRTGMTWAFALDAVVTASLPGVAMDVFYLAYNYEMTREFMAACEQFAMRCAPGYNDKGVVWDDRPLAGVSLVALSAP